MLAAILCSQKLTIMFTSFVEEECLVLRLLRRLTWVTWVLWVQRTVRCWLRLHA